MATTCNICLGSNETGEILVELRHKQKQGVKDIPHYFHQSCLTPWLNLHDYCPLDRLRITTIDGAHLQIAPARLITGLTEEELTGLAQEDNLGELLNYNRIEGLSRESIGIALFSAFQHRNYDMLEVLRDYYLIGIGELSAERRVSLLRNCALSGNCGILSRLLEFLALSNQERDELIETIIRNGLSSLDTDWNRAYVIRELLAHGPLSEASRIRFLQMARENDLAEVARSFSPLRSKGNCRCLITTAALGVLLGTCANIWR